MPDLFFLRAGRKNHSLRHRPWLRRQTVVSVRLSSRAADAGGVPERPAALSPTQRSHERGQKENAARQLPRFLPTQGGKVIGHVKTDPLFTMGPINFISPVPT